MDKMKFAQAVIDYRNGRLDEDEFFRALYELATLVYRSNRLFSNVATQDDLIHDAILSILKLRVWEKVNQNTPSTIFSYFWGRIRWSMLTALKKYGKWEPSIDYKSYYSDLEKSLGPIMVSSIRQDDDIEFGTIMVKREKSKRGRKPKDEWKQLYEYLREKKTVNVNDLLNQIPAALIGNIKDPKRHIISTMRRYARNNGAKLSTKGDMIYLYE